MRNDTTLASSPSLLMLLEVVDGRGAGGGASGQLEVENEDERVQLAGQHPALWFEAGAEPVVLLPRQELPGA